MFQAYKFQCNLKIKQMHNIYIILHLQMISVNKIQLLYIFFAKYCILKWKKLLVDSFEISSVYGKIHGIFSSLEIFAERK